MKHLTEVQRYEISAYVLSGKSQVFIAKQLSVSKSCICRELKRNSDIRSGHYKPVLAQNKAQKRIMNKHKAVRFTEDMKTTASELLVIEQYSPEQIVGHCKKTGISMVSHERLYQWLWLDKKEKGELHTPPSAQERSQIPQAGQFKGHSWHYHR